jgi:hypothetical protein
MPHLTPIRPTRRTPRGSLGQDFFARAEPLALVDGVVLLVVAAAGAAEGLAAASGFEEEEAVEEEAEVGAAVAGAADAAGFTAAAGLAAGLDGAEAAAVNSPVMIQMRQTE